MNGLSVMSIALERSRNASQTSGHLTNTHIYKELSQIHKNTNATIKKNYKMTINRLIHKEIKLINRHENISTLFIK